MSQRGELEIDIAEGGETTIKVKGVAGSGCKNLTSAIEKALGTVTKDVKLPEFSHATKQGNQAKANS